MACLKSVRRQHFVNLFRASSQILDTTTASLSLHTNQTVSLWTTHLTRSGHKPLFESKSRKILPLVKHAKTSKPDKRHMKQKPAIDNYKWSVVAYNLSEALKIDNARNLLENLSDYTINDLPDDIYDQAVMLSSKSHIQKWYDSQHNKQLSADHPLCDIFLFREGSIVFWGVPYEQQKRVLISLASLRVKPNESDWIQEEKEFMSYSLSTVSEKSKLNQDTLQLSLNQELISIRLDQFAFSHAVALSVKLGIWEVMLDNYIDSVDWITESMKNGKDIKLSKEDVFKKTGEILAMKHSINLDSDLLDLPDVYWDRNKQEDMFISLSSYLNIRKRTNVINEKLNNCCELMNLLSSHMNDRHHIKLEWLIVILITFEVVLEVARCLK